MLKEELGPKRGRMTQPVLGPPTERPDEFHARTRETRSVSGYERRLHESRVLHDDRVREVIEVRRPNPSGVTFE